MTAGVDTVALSGSAGSAKDQPLDGGVAVAAALPRYSPFRRLQEWEPQGRWLSARPQLNWPDTVLSPTVLRWLPRVMLLATVALCALTIGAMTDLRGFWVLVGLAVVIGGWQEWWMRWQLSELAKRVLAFAVQWTFGLAMVIVNPLASFFCFAGFMIAGTLFTGGWLVTTILLVSAQVALGQIGGIGQLPTSVPIYLALVGINGAISLVFITLSNRREEAVAHRDAAVHKMLITQHANEALQEQLLHSAHDTGMREERARLARELHDTVAQGLVAVVTQLEAIDDGDLHTTGVRDRVDRAKDLARRSLGEARRAVDALHPPALDDHDLPDALRRLVHQWGQLGDVEAVVRTSGPPRRTDHDAALIRVAQEGLSNVARHAGASRVTVTLTYLEDEILLDIRDDGTGFDPTATTGPGVGGGHGLPGMADRLRLAGGRLTVESEPGGGCVISAAVPE